MSSPEKTPPVEINHYADKYWNDLPEIRAYLCKNATGDRNLWWIPYFKKRYAQNEFSNCLIIACGNGRIERELYDYGIAREFDAFDYSDTYLEEAKAQKGTRPINYFKSSFESLSLKKKYELVVNVAALHHVECLDSLMKKISEAMPPYGLFVNWDYVGPNRNQYSDEHLKLMTSINNSLPPRFQNRSPLRFGLDNFISGDITEAVKSSEIIPTFEKHFEIIERRNLGGGIAYQLLWNNIDEFLKDDPEAKKALQQIINLDDLHTRNRTVATLFAFFIGYPRHKTHALNEEAKQCYLDRLEAALEKKINENNELASLAKTMQQEKEKTLQQHSPIAGRESPLKRLRKFFR